MSIIYGDFGNKDSSLKHKVNIALNKVADSNEPNTEQSFLLIVDTGVDFKIYGNGWPNWPEYKGVLPSEDIGKLYTSAKSGIAIIAPAQRDMGMINNRYSEMGYCELPITTYKYDLDWFGAEKYLNFVENKEEAYTTIKDMIGNPSKYKSKSVELKKFVQNKTNEFFEKLEGLIVEE